MMIVRCVEMEKPAANIYRSALLTLEELDYMYSSSDNLSRPALRTKGGKSPAVSNESTIKEYMTYNAAGVRRHASPCNACCPPPA